MARRIPQCRLHKPSGLAVVTLNGVDHYLGRHGTDESRRKYERFIAEWLLNQRTPPIESKHPDNTIDQLLVRYLQFAQTYYGAASPQLENIRYAFRPFRRLYGDRCGADFGPLALKAVRQEMIDRGWSRRYINCIGRIKRFFRWCVENELVRPEVFTASQAVEGLR